MRCTLGGIGVSCASFDAEELPWQTAGKALRPSTQHSAAARNAKVRNLIFMTSFLIYSRL